jgi:hypothetical protein
MGLGSWVMIPECRVKGSGLRVEGSGSRFKGSGFRV